MAWPDQVPSAERWTRSSVYSRISAAKAAPWARPTSSGEPTRSRTRIGWSAMGPLLGRGPDGVGDDRHRLVDLLVGDVEGREEPHAVGVEAGPDGDDPSLEGAEGDRDGGLGV